MSDDAPVTYRVEFQIPYGPIQTTRVMIVPGYTTVDDIPTIIAVSRTGRPSDAEFIRIVSREEITCE